MYLGNSDVVSRLKTWLSQGQTRAFIFGKKRCGKTSLVNAALENYKGLVIDVEFVEAPIEDNLKRFVTRIQEVTANSLVDFSSFKDAFAFLGILKTKIVVVFDGFEGLQNAESKPGKLMGLFSTLLTNLPTNVSLLILSSSLTLSAPYFAKGSSWNKLFEFVYELKEFDYLGVLPFRPEFSFNERIPFYSVFGGLPFANLALNPFASLEINIEKLFLSSDGALRFYAERLALSELPNHSNADRILRLLSLGDKKYSELEDALSLPNNGSLARMLKPLLTMGLVSKLCPVNASQGSEKAFYTLNDNLLRFYYAFVYGNANAISKVGEKAFYKEKIQPDLNDYLTSGFTRICRDYLKRNLKALGALDAGLYLYEDPKTKESKLYPLALKDKEGFSLFGVYYAQKPIAISTLDPEEAAYRALGNLKLSHYGAFAFHGFTGKKEGTILTSGNDFYL